MKGTLCRYCEELRNYRRGEAVPALMPPVKAIIACSINHAKPARPDELAGLDIRGYPLAISNDNNLGPFENATWARYCKGMLITNE